MAIEIHSDKTPSSEELRAATSLPMLSKYELPVWQLGRAYVFLQNQGYGQKGIARAIGRDQSYVSRCIAVYTGLSPKAHEILCRLGPLVPSIQKLVKLSKLRKGDEPDEEAQLVAVQKMVKKMRANHSLGIGQMAASQFLKLRQMPLPPHAVPFVEPVMKYLSGETDSLSFPEPPCPSTTETHRARPQASTHSRFTDSTRATRASGSFPSQCDGKSRRR